MSSLKILKNKLNSYPVITLAEYPTPLEYLPRLSKEIKREIFIKRDDSIGPCMGGNKTRKLEYLMADANRHKARRVVTYGGLQSNHVRITTAAAQKLGMETHLFFFEPPPREMSGNLLLDQISGAKIHFIPLGTAGSGMTLETTNRLVRLAARILVGPNYFIPVGGHNWLGCLGYVQAALEIHQQACDFGIENAWLVSAVGTGGTLAGLCAGLSIIGSPLRPFGIDVTKLWKRFPNSLVHLSKEICNRLGFKREFKVQEIPLIESVYATPKYGIPSSTCLKVIRKLARLEGILLDPVYTAKAFAGMLDLLETGTLGVNEPIIFLHTGGLPALFAFGDSILYDG